MRHQLLFIVAAPAAGALLLGLLPGARAAFVRVVTGAATALALALSLALWFAFEPRGAQWQFVDQVEAAGWRSVFALDGFGLVLVLLIAFVSLTGAALLTRETARLRPWGIALLLVEAGTLGAIVSLDLRPMFLFWQLAVGAMLGTMMLAGARRTTIAFGTLAAVASVAMFSGLLVLGEQYRRLASTVSFDVRQFQSMPVAKPVQMQAFMLLALGCLMPLALTATQAWRLARNVDRHHEPVGVLSALLLATLTVFGLLRIMLPVTPEAARTFGWVLASAGVAAAVLAVVTAAASRSLAALSLIALGQVMLAVIGLSAATPAGVTGGAVQVVAAGLAIAAVLPIAGNRAPIESARPRADGLAIVAALAAIAGSITGVRLIATGVAPFGRTAAIGSIAIGVGNAIMLAWIAWRRRDATSVAAVTHRDVVVDTSLAGAAAALLIGLAIHPAALLSRLETSVARVIVRVSPEYSSQVADCLNQPPPAPPPDSGLPAGAMLAAPCNDGPGQPADPIKKP